MTWVRLDDGFPDHPKVLAAGPEVAWLYVCGLGYSARHLTDGFIPLSIVKRLVDADDPVVLAARLVEVRLWDVAEGGYRAHTRGIAALPRSRRCRSAMRRAWEAIAHRIRPLILDRDGYRCQVCGSEVALHIDHVIPIALGGDNDPANLQVLCRPCNLSKGAKL